MADTNPRKLAVVLIRGLIGTSPDVRKTLALLKLEIKNGCVLIDDTETYRGMLQVIKDYTTWGPVDNDVIEQLEKRRKGDKKIVRLSPPLKGFGRKGVKIPFKNGGAIGNRKDKINDLLKRMMH